MPTLPTTMTELRPAHAPEADPHVLTHQDSNISPTAEYREIIFELDPPLPDSPELTNTWLAYSDRMATLNDDGLGVVLTLTVCQATTMASVRTIALGAVINFYQAQVDTHGREL